MKSVNILEKEPIFCINMPEMLLVVTFDVATASLMDEIVYSDV